MNREINIVSSIGGIPIICGGNTDSQFVYGCRQYDFDTDAWTLTSAQPGGLNIWGSYDYSEDWGLVVSGGSVVNDEGAIAFTNQAWR